MKTRFAYIILGVFAVMVISSCEKTPFSHKGMEGNLTVSLGVAKSAATKTAGSGTIEDTESEAAINPETVRLFLVKSDASGNPASGVPVEEITDIEDVTESGNVTLEAKLYGATGYYLLFAIANCPESLTLDLTDYTHFIGEYSAVAADVAVDNSFMMVNQQNEVGGCAGVLINMDGNNVSATINLERVVAKITVAESNFIDFAPYHTVVIGTDDTYAVSSMSLDGVALLNCVNRFYLTQRWANGTTEGTDYLLVSPSSSTSYSKDNYYFTDPASLTFQGLNADSQFDPMYCLENNSPYYNDCTDTETYTKEGVTIDLTYLKSHAVDRTKMKGRVTGVVFRALFKLADGFQAELGTNPIIGDEDGTWANVTSLNAVTKAADSEEPSESIKTMYKYKGIYYCDQRALFSHNGWEIGSLTSSEPVDPEQYDLGILTADLRANGVKVYEDGHVYYTYWIVDPNYTDGEDPATANDAEFKAFHYYSVMRNTCYRLTVNSVTSFGDEIPGGDYHRIDPVGEMIPRISVTISIGDWATENCDYQIPYQPYVPIS